MSRRMADWTSDSSMGCGGNISSSCLSSDGLSISSIFPHAPAVLGQTCMPTDTGTCKRLLTKQCSYPDLGVFVLVQTLFPFFGSGALNNEG